MRIIQSTFCALDNTTMVSTTWSSLTLGVLVLWVFGLCGYCCSGGFTFLNYGKRCIFAVTAASSSCNMIKVTSCFPFRGSCSQDPSSNLALTGPGAFSTSDTPAQAYSSTSNVSTTSIQRRVCYNFSHRHQKDDSSNQHHLTILQLLLTPCVGP